jgi:predicted AAA+ superfamily ATPase
VLTQALAWRETAAPRPEVYYWRTHGGLEVDFVIEAGRRLLPVEVKAARGIGMAHARGVVAFLEEHPKTAPFGIIAYGGDEVVHVAANVVAVPIGCLWALGER